MTHIKFRSSVASTKSNKSCIEDLENLKSSQFFPRAKILHTLVSVIVALRASSLADNIVHQIPPDQVQRTSSCLNLKLSNYFLKI